MKRLFALIVGASLCFPSIGAMAWWQSIQQGGTTGVVVPSPQIDMNFATATYSGCASPAACLTVVRASSATDLITSSASGYAYNTFSSNVLSLSPGIGLLSFPAATNQLLNSTAPATQTTGSLANGSYTLWVNGSGSATMSAGTATGCGTGVATNGSKVTFTTSGAAGTCTVTVTGSLNAFQLEAGTTGTSFIVTAGTTVTRAADVISTAGALLTDTSPNTFSILIGTPGLISATGILFSLNSNSYVGNLNTATFAFISSPSTNRDLQAGSGSWTGSMKIAVGTDGTGFSGSLGNGTVLTNTPTYGTSTAGWLGSNLGASSFSGGLINRIQVWTTRLADPVLKAATQ